MNNFYHLQIWENNYPKRVLGVELDYDPSEGQKQNWENYKWLAQTKILIRFLMQKIITCRNLSHREKLILSLIFILLPIIFYGNFAKSHEKKLHQVFINELIQSECKNRKNISYELLKMRERNVSFVEARRFVSNSDFARKKEVSSAEI